MGVAAPGVSVEAMTALEHHPFGGNIRELRNTIQSALVECEGTVIEPTHLRFISLLPREAAAPPPPATDTAATDLPSTLNLAELEQFAVRRALQEADGNMSKAARLLGISRPKLYRKVAVGDSAPTD